MMLYRGSLSSQHMESENTPISQMPYRKNTISRKRYFVGTNEECDYLHTFLINVLKYPAESITCHGIDDNTSALGFNSPFMTEIGFRMTLEAIE